MNNRPRGRSRNVSGQGKDIYKRGSGLGTGPVGNGRTSSRGSGSFGGGPSRDSSGGGGGGIIAIIIVVVVLLLGGGGISGLFGNILGLLGGNSGGTSPLGAVTNVSSGWVQSANTGSLDRSVASGAREKRTGILGNGQDKVTIMVYMCGTDLESGHGMATSDLKEMESATLSDKVNVIVYTGGCKNWKHAGISSTENQIFKVKSGGLTPLANDGNKAMTDPNTLSGFIKYCKNNYPANRCDLILWDHGGGTLSGFGYDEKTSVGSMTLSKINKALTDGGVKFDFVGYDACLMATLENALMLDSHADYLIASEETEPGVGWYYKEWLTDLSKNTSMPTLDIGKKIVDDFVSTCARTCAGQKTTLSLIDLAELSATVPESLKTFAEDTSERLDNNGYKAVSDARASTREFSTNKIDQIDLVHFALNLNTSDSRAFADTLLSAVKYNKTSSDITNAYGISAYFPYQKLSKVDSAVAAYDNLGLEGEYTDCMKRFASMEQAGQSASGASSGLDLGSLLSGIAPSGSSGGSIADLIGSLVGGGSGSGLDFLSGFLNTEKATKYVSENHLDSTKLVWKNTSDGWVMELSEEQWSLVHSLDLNVFYEVDDGYFDMGLDNVFEFTDDGKLKGEFDGCWIAINSQPVPYYHTDTLDDGRNWTITGYVPVLVNGVRSQLILVFDNAHESGYVAGVRYDYVDGETDTVAKGAESLNKGDVIDFVGDFYKKNADGSFVYIDSYCLGDQMVYDGTLTVSDVTINASKATAAFLFTDIYNNSFWSQALK
ncbi:MAG: peptidase C11 [Clostridia bacterium]|nr:peptidase C11 [Clostridia bacterium]